MWRSKISLLFRDFFSRIISRSQFSMSSAPKWSLNSAAHLIVFHRKMTRQHFSVKFYHIYLIFAKYLEISVFDVVSTKMIIELRSTFNIFHRKMTRHHFPWNFVMSTDFFAKKMSRSQFYMATTPKWSPDDPLHFSFFHEKVEKKLKMSICAIFRCQEKIFASIKLILERIDRHNEYIPG